MIDIKSTKFLELSDKAKVLLLTAIVNKEEIRFSKYSAQIIGLSYPGDELFFIQILQEIESKKINYKLEKLLFIKPSPKDCEDFLILLQNRLKKTLSLQEIKHVSMYFFEYYEKKDWKINKTKMLNWKEQLIFAANNWDFKFKKETKKTTLVDEIQKAFS